MKEFKGISLPLVFGPDLLSGQSPRKLSDLPGGYFIIEGLVEEIKENSAPSHDYSAQPRITTTYVMEPFLTAEGIIQPRVIASGGLIQNPPEQNQEKLRKEPMSVSMPD